MAPNPRDETGLSRSTETKFSFTQSRTHSPPRDSPEKPAKRARTIGDSTNTPANEPLAFLDDEDDAAIAEQIAAELSAQHLRKVAPGARQAAAHSPSNGGPAEEEHGTHNDNAVPRQQEEPTNSVQAPTPQQPDDAMDVDEDDNTSQTRQSSILSRCYHEDLTADLGVDLDNLVATYTGLESTHTHRIDVETHLKLAVPFPRDDSRDVRHTLRKWLKEAKSPESPSYFCRRLRNIYPVEGFSGHSLVGQDLALVKTFMGFVEEMPLEVFLVVLHRSADDEELSSESFIARRIVDLYGRVLVTHVPISSLFVPPTPAVSLELGLPSDKVSEAVSHPTSLSCTLC